jgi:hypothetical protein
MKYVVQMGAGAMKYSYIPRFRKIDSGTDTQQGDLIALLTKIRGIHRHTQTES